MSRRFEQVARADLAFIFMGICLFLSSSKALTVIHRVLSWSDLFLFLAGLTVAFQALRGRARLPLPGAWILSAGLIFATAIISAISKERFYDIGESLKLIIGYVGLPLVLAWVMQGRSRKDIDRLLSIYVAGALLSAMVAITSWHGIPFFGLHDAAASIQRRAIGLSYTSTSFGFASALAVPMAIYLALCARSMVKVFAYIIVAALLFYSIELSGSRASLGAVMVSMLPIIWISIEWARDGRSKLLLFGLIGLIALVLLIAVGAFSVELDRYSALSRTLGLSEFSAQGSNSARARWNARCWNVFLSSPIYGGGYEYIRLAHGHALGLLAASGAIGVIAVTLWFALLFRLSVYVHRSWFLWASLYNRQLMAVLCALALSWFLHGLFQNFLTDRNGYIWVGVLLFLALNAPPPRQASAG